MNQEILKKQRAEERKEKSKKEKEEKIIKNVDDLSKVERKLEVIDDDEETPTTSTTITKTDTTTDKEEKEDDTPAINKERSKHPDPVNNGGVTDKYTWTQTLKDFTLIIPIEEETKSKQIKLD